MVAVQPVTFASQHWHCSICAGVTRAISDSRQSLHRVQSQLSIFTCDTGRSPSTVAWQLTHTSICGTEDARVNTKAKEFLLCTC